MRIESVQAVLTGHRILNPRCSAAGPGEDRDRQRHGRLGRGLDQLGPPIPPSSAPWWRTCAPATSRARPAGHPGPRADLKVALDGYLGWEGLSSQTIGAIEIALWDILGKTLGAPIHQLLGGRAYPIPLYGTGTTMFEQSHEWHALLRPVRRARLQGRQGAPRPADEDVELVKLVRGTSVRTSDRVDSYWFHDVDSAIELCGRIAPFRIHFFEEPIPQYQIEGSNACSTARPSGSRSVSGCTRRGRSPSSPAGTRSRFEPDATLNGGLCRAWRSPTSRRGRRSRSSPHRWSDRRRSGGQLQWATAARPSVRVRHRA